MTSTCSLSDNELIEFIVTQGRTELLEELYDKYIGRIEEISADWAASKDEAEIISYFAMIRTLLSISTHQWKIPFGVSVYANVYNTWIDWKAQLKYGNIDKEKTPLFAYRLKKEGAKRQMVLDKIKATFEQRIFTCSFSDNMKLFQSNQITNKSFLLENGITEQTATLLLMNVWSDISKTYDQNYREPFQLLQHVAKSVITDTKLVDNCRDLRTSDVEIAGTQRVVNSSVFLPAVVNRIKFNKQRIIDAIMN